MQKSDLEMYKINKLAMASAIAIAVLSTGCAGSNSTDNSSTEADSIAVVQETESIAGLPAQKDTVINDVKGTSYEFSSVEQLKDFLKKSPNAAAYAQGIIPTVADASLSYATKLINNGYDYFVVVDKDKMRVILFDKFGRVVKSFGMAGPRSFGTKHTKGDCRTPEGFFSAEGTYDSSQWHYITDEGIVTPGYPFGPKFIRVKNPVTTSVGIHGTSSPSSIGKRTSHGCIRLHNESILELVKYVKPGTPIIILPGSGDRQVNQREGHPTVFFETGVERYSNASANVPANNGVKAKPAVQQQEQTEPAEQEGEENTQEQTGQQSETEPVQTPAAPETPETPIKTEPVNPD